MLEKYHIDRFFKFIDYSKGKNDCWLWIGSQNGCGYGRFLYKGKYELVHKVSYEHFYNDSPSGFRIHHECETQLCVNPLHLVKIIPGDDIYDHYIERVKYYLELDII